jgi:hypothetical protein
LSEMLFCVLLQKEQVLRSVSVDAAMGLGP